MAYRFGPFLYDSVSRGLLQDGAEIPLTHKSRELLLLFLHNPGRLLTREEIVSNVWPDVAVTDDALRFQVGELRKAFGVKGEKYIQTIRARAGGGERTTRAGNAARAGDQPRTRRRERQHRGQSRERPRQGIRHRGDVWGAPYGHDWPWWKVQVRSYVP